MAGSNRRLSLNVLNIYQKYKTTVQYGAGTPRGASRSMNYYTVPPRPGGMVVIVMSRLVISRLRSQKLGGPLGSIPQLAD